MLCRDTARSARAQLTELVGLDHRDELRRIRAKQRNDEARAVGEAGVHLRSCVAELEIRRRHHRERTVLEPQAVTRPVLDGAARHPLEAGLDHGHRLRRREQPPDVLLGQVPRHEPDFLRKLIAPLVSITAHSTSSSEPMFCCRAA